MGKPLKELICIEQQYHEVTCEGCGASKEDLVDALDEHYNLIMTEIKKIDNKISKCSNDDQKILYTAAKISFRRALGAMKESFPVILGDKDG